ncbi:hypothetical protein EB093_00325 [bacterium]|nr:hypothetical protein [bacterium]
MNKFTHKIGVALAMVGLVSATTVAGVRYNLDEFENASSRGGVGVIQAGGSTFFKASLGKDFNIGPVELGLDFNTYIPASGGSYYPPDLQWITLRTLGYTHENLAGIKYGRLTNVTYGYGLLLDNYDSGLGGESSEFSYKKAGLKGWVNTMGIRLDAFGTGSSVVGGRIAYELPEVTFFGTPIVIGATAVRDQDGLSNQVNGGTVTRPSASGYAGDIGLPFAGDFLVGYLEYAKLDGQGQGYSTGLKGNAIDIFKYRFEYRSLESGFVPGYFNSTYEATSFNFEDNAPKTNTSGFLGSMSLEVPSLPFRGALQTEIYSDRSLLTAAAGWSNIGGTTGVINYTMPFQNSSNPILESSILYKTGGLMDYVVNIKRVYYASNQFTESYGVEVRFNPNKLLPGIF